MPRMDIVSRKRWGARQARPMASQQAPTEAFVHYSDTVNAERIDTFAEQCAAMRAFQDFHMNGRGWSDIGYAFVVFQPQGEQTKARAFRGRLTRYVPAAQEGHNTRTLPICVVADGGDELKRNTRYVIEQLIRRYPSVKTLGGHRDVTATTCPGDAIYAQVPRMAQAAGVKVFKR